MTCYETGIAILALNRKTRNDLALALRTSNDTAMAREGYEREYFEITGTQPPKGAWEALEARATVVAGWGQSDSPATIDRLAAMGVSVPGSLMTAEHRKRVALGAYHTDRRAREYARAMGNLEVTLLPIAPTPELIAPYDPLPAGCHCRDHLADRGVALPNVDTLTPDDLSALANAVATRCQP